MRKCIIWGIGNDYERLYNSLQFEIYKGNIEIIAAVSKRENIFGKYIDHIPLITSEDIGGGVEFDYIIVCSNLYFGEICDEICALGIDRNRILDGNVFSYALFDFNKYIKLIENPITIISDDCWGGEVYHTLALPFHSPTININWQTGEYVKFITDLPYYLRQPLQCGREGDLEAGIYPIGLLGEGDKQVSMELIHNHSFGEAKQQWERRQKRVNFNNIFVKLGMNRKDDWKTYVDIFEGLPYKKLCIYPYVRDKEGYISSALYAKWRQENDVRSRIDSYDINDWLRNPGKMRGTIDILALLNGETQCFRASNE